MKLVNFPLESVDEELPAIYLDSGDWIFSVTEVCMFADLATKKNAATWVRNNIPLKWVIEFKLPGKEGRPGLYLTKPGFYYAICQGKSEIALKFRDEVFEVILPKIDASGGYIMPNATSEQLEALQQQIESLQKREKWLRHENQKLLDRDEEWFEADLKQLVRLFIASTIKDYAYRSEFCTPYYSSPKQPYSFELYWIGYWKRYIKFARLEKYPYQYLGAIDLLTLDTWRLLTEVYQELKDNQQYKRFHKQLTTPNFAAYLRVIRDNLKIG